MRSLSVTRSRWDRKRWRRKKTRQSAILRLLDGPALHKGDVITIEAMGCQKDIAGKIIEKQADYLLEVKDNRPTLRQNMEHAMEEIGSFHTDEQVRRHAKEESLMEIGGKQILVLPVWKRLLS